ARRVGVRHPNAIRSNLTRTPATACPIVQNPGSSRHPQVNRGGDSGERRIVMTRLASPPAVVLAAVLAMVFFPTEKSGDPPPAPPAAPREVRMANQPKVPGTLRLNVRERREEPRGSRKFKLVERTLDWEVAETAIIVCDMWDDHHCKIAAQRVGVMAPRM